MLQLYFIFTVWKISWDCSFFTWAFVDTFLESKRKLKNLNSEHNTPISLTNNDSIEYKCKIFFYTHKCKIFSENQQSLPDLVWFSLNFKGRKNIKISEFFWLKKLFFRKLFNRKLTLIKIFQSGNADIVVIFWENLI